MMSPHVVNAVMISTSCERRFNAQEEMLALSGTQRHVGGPLCTNKHRKRHVLWFAQAKLPDSLLRLHIRGMVLFVYAAKSYIASYQMQEELRI